MVDNLRSRCVVLGKDVPWIHAILFLSFVLYPSVEWLIIDESDKLFEEGKTGFRDQLGIIYQACDSSQVRRAMFSATFAFDVEQWCRLNLDNVVTVSIGARLVFNINTVKPVHKDHPRETRKAVFIDRWSLCTGFFSTCFNKKPYSMEIFKMWSLKTGGL